MAKNVRSVPQVGALTPRFCIAAATACLLPATAVATAVDGRLDEPHWRSAAVYEDFVVTQPLTLATPRLRTVARIVSLQEGLAIAVTSEQPARIAERRAAARSRDSSPMASDLVYVMVDFDGTGVRAYEFMVGRGGAQRDGTWSNENQPSLDWDGRWQSAVHDTGDEWTVEYLIPWSVVPMREADGERRTLGINVGRIVEAMGERYSWPAISFQQPRYVSGFAKVEVAAWRDRALDLIPYATGLRDFAGNGWDGKAGIDVFWKPSSQLQLNAAINPDFGQVESDDLVVNFDAIETFRTDKRPFFTENQTLFNLRTPQGGELVYTRRVGGPEDGGSGEAASIDAAVKLSGSAGGWDYGAFVVAEADETGRDFFAIRSIRPSGDFQIGHAATWANRPVLDRRALVNAVDWRWTPGSTVSAEGAFLHSDLSTGTTDEHGTGGWMRWLHTPGNRWEHTLELTHLDDRIDFNDFGFLPRNDLNEARWNTRLRKVGSATDGSNASVSWNLSATGRSNDSGDTLQGRWFLSRAAEPAGGGLWYSELRYDPAGFDDLISRGNGLVRRTTRNDFWQYYQSAQGSRWKYLVGGWWFQEGLGGRAFQLETQLTMQATETLSLSLSWYPRWSDDWLVWREEDLFARYERRQVDARLGANWFPAARHELRVKAQWLVIDARDARAMRIGPGGRLQHSGDVIPDLSVASFGLQIRYRYEISRQRDLYVVYGRGGFSQDEERSGVGNLFDQASRLRDSDQLLVKLSWRL